MVHLLESCRIYFNEPLFGLRLAELQGPDVFGCVAALARAAPTVREGLQALIDFLPAAHSRQGELLLTHQGATAELRWLGFDEFAIAEQANYQYMLLNVKILRMLTRSDFRPDYVTLRLDVPRQSLVELAKCIGCRVECGRQDNAVGFPVGILDRPVASSNRLTYRLLKDHLRKMKDAADANVVARVESYIRGAMPSGRCSIVRCAKKLGTTVRSLQGQLKKAGLSFSDILEEQRVELAKGELRSGVSSVQEIAGMLGYSEQATFGRAFKRWTGLSPRAFRDAQATPQPRQVSRGYEAVSGAQ